MPYSIPPVPRWVKAILGWQGTWVVARIGLASAYLLGGVTKLFNLEGAIAVARLPMLIQSFCRVGPPARAGLQRCIQSERGTW